ncbi:unnamed protein product [Albugo candida]|uniref:Uncharacterized protein n=1 Tax=Albugo candida TaxID=65357 RepID=A0A024GQS9_9STRA|nr:unnamed protein product [Albugo candida]|eukprot:CCI49077.1 unnamed protein product [Albugo candida]
MSLSFLQKSEDIASKTVGIYFSLMLVSLSMSPSHLSPKSSSFQSMRFLQLTCLIEKPRICRAHCLSKVTDNPSFSKQSVFDLESANAVRDTKFFQSIQLFPLP